MLFDSLLSLSQDMLPHYLLIFMRMSGLFFIAPVFSRRQVPPMLKAGLSLAMTLLLAPVVPPVAAAGTIRVLPYLVAVLLEISVGMFLGLISLFFISAVMVAGQVIDVEIGMGMASVLDPQMGMQTSVSGTLLNLILILYFLINNGHLRLAAMLARSFQRIPVGQAQLSQQLAWFSLEQFTLAFALAASLMLPLIGAALLAEIAMGILMRAIPQLNAYMVGIPLKVLVGLSVLYFLQPFYVGYCDRLFDHLFTASEQAIILMGGQA